MNVLFLRVATIGFVLKKMYHKKSFTLSLLSGVSILAISHALASGINVESGNGATITHSTAGVEVLNIVAPTAAGVSHNKFTDFNVNKNGLIVNNMSLNSGVQSEASLGGAVTFNPNIGRGSTAQVILNEVTSTNPSLLQGYTEIFGDKAAYILANPNGIGCDGCGFINTSRLTLVTGRPEFENGSIKSFNLAPTGVIEIGGQNFGMHISDSPAELVSNVIRIAANVYADKDLHLLTGNKSYNYQTNEVFSDSSQINSVAIDSSALGGMYAGAIKIYASQNGMGIKADGNLVADTGNLEITADGNIDFKVAAAFEGNITARSKSGSITSQVIQSNKDISLASAENTNFVSAAAENINIKAQNISGKSGGQISISQNVGLNATGSIALDSDYILSDTFSALGESLTFNTQLYSSETLNLSAIGRTAIQTGFVRSKDLTIKTGNFDVAGDLIGQSIDLTADTFSLDGNLFSTNATLTLSQDFVNKNNKLYADNLTINALSLRNESVLSSGNITLNLANNLFNADKIYAAGTLDITAADVQNYGQIAANGNIGISANNYINYRDSGLLSGSDIAITVKKDIINYLSEIYAVGNITLTGNADTLSGVDYATVYDNPYIENQHTASVVVNNNQAELPVPTESDGVLDIYLPSLRITLSLPPDAFAEDAPLGASYSIDGYTVYIGHRIVTPRQVSTVVDVEYQVEVPYEAEIEGEFNEDGTPKTETKIRIETRIRQETQTHTEYDISFDNPDAMTVLDADGNEISATPFEGQDLQENNLTGQNGSTQTSDSLMKQVNQTGYVAPTNQANAIVNLGGRIEALGNINIASDQLYNIALNHNTGANAYQLGYLKIRDGACWNCGWQELGRYYVQAIHLTGEAGQILAGGNLSISARDILNQSSTLSAKRNLLLNTTSLKNTSYYEVTDPLQINLGAAIKKRSKGRVRHKVYWDARYYQDIVYSKSRSLITGGKNVIINAQDGNVQNDQTVAAEGRYTSGRTNRPDTITNTVSVDLTVPKGSNGLFARSNNPNYLITSTVDFLNNASYIGSDYFFNELGDGGIGFNNRKMLGDSAYETRLVMDAIRDATSGHYLTSGLTSDADQMKALFDAAIKEQKALDLKIGVSLTAEQIARLSNDIIWYVEQEIDGQKVLVPQIYLSMATLQKIADGETGDTITGENVQISAGTITNAGKLSASDVLSLTADDLINRSGLITADKTAIAGKNVLNETLKNREEWRKGSTYDLQETLGKTSEIKGKTGVQIDIDGDLTMKAASISSDGNVSVSANNIVLDTVELHNRHENVSTKKKTFGKSVTTTITDSVKNMGSTITAGGAVIANAVKNLFAKGATIESGGDAQITAGEDITLKAATDTSYSYSRTKKSGFMKSSDHIVEDEASKLAASLLSTQQGLTIVSGKDTTVIASTLDVGTNANILTGYTVNSDGTLSENGTGSFNLLNDYETTRHYEKHKRSDMTKALAPIALNLIAPGLGTMFDPTLIGLATGNSSLGCSGGKCGLDINLGSSSSTEIETITKTAVGSVLNVGGDLNVSSTGDVLVRGSDIFSGNNITFTAGNDISILSSESSNASSSRSQEKKISASLKVGNVAVDTVMAIDDVTKASEAVKKAEKTLERITKLHNQGKATGQAVAEASLGLTMATMNLASATQALASQAAYAASTKLTLGFYADYGFSSETKKSSNTSENTISTASNVVAEKDISFNANNDMTQTGSVVLSKSGDITYNIANDLTLNASKDTYRTTNKSDTKTANIGASTKGSANVNIAGSKSDSKSSGTHHNNAQTLAEKGTITFTVGSDMTGTGYNALAENIKANVGGDLTLTSSQNIDMSSGHSNNFGAGYSTSGSISANLGFSRDKSDRAWVDDVSSIIGTNSVDITVGDTLSLTGAMIANIQDGTDGGNLTITANHLDVQDIFNRDYSDSAGFNVGTSVGVSATNAAHPNGSTTVGIQHQGQEIEGLTQATIGHGTLNIADGSGADVNRDINTVEIILRDETTGAIDSTLTVDHRLFSESGRTKMVKEMAELPDNMRNMSGNFVDQSHELAENMNDTLINDIFGKPLLGVYSAVVGSPGGIVATFNEGNSDLYLNGTLVSPDQLSKNSIYLVNGIMTSKSDAKSYSEDGTLVRHNPSYGIVGDLFEAGMGKILGWNGTTAQLLSMDRIVAGDLTARKDMKDAINRFHSQGTIIGLGAGNILTSNGTTINSSQSFAALGPAVTRDDWKNTWLHVTEKEQVKYQYNEGDKVLCLTTLDCIKDPKLLFNNKFLSFPHGLKSYQHKKD